VMPAARHGLVHLAGKLAQMVQGARQRQLQEKEWEETDADETGLSVPELSTVQFSKSWTRQCLAHA
jgi:hypothetical protein